LHLAIFWTDRELGVLASLALGSEAVEELLGLFRGLVRLPRQVLGDSLDVLARVSGADVVVVQYVHVIGRQCGQLQPVGLDVLREHDNSVEGTREKCCPGVVSGSRERPKTTGETVR
jgi:hypothetical protein